MFPLCYLLSLHHFMSPKTTSIYDSIPTTISSLLLVMITYFKIYTFIPMHKWTMTSIIYVGDLIYITRYLGPLWVFQNNLIYFAKYAWHDIIVENFIKHDWLRALRMSTYGFIMYGPGSHAWYELLDRDFVNQSLKNLLVKIWVFFSILYTFLVVGNVH